MFNPHARVRLLPIPGGAPCIVVDDALAAPERWVARAAESAAGFAAAAHNAYPGIELRLPDAVTARLDEFFARHARRALGFRRTVEAYSRLSIVTTPPDQLEPRQWICHRDRQRAAAGEGVAACVLYLFTDPALGGTGFYRPRRPEPEVARLVHDSGVLAGPEFTARHGITPGYQVDSNAWFEKVASVEARFNRLIFYDGMQFHGSDILQPGRLDPDPARGRLTITGFFTCRRQAA